MVPFFRIEEGREATKGQAQTCSKRSAWRGLAAAVSMTSCVGMMVVMAWGTSSAPRLEGGHPQQRTTQLAEGGLGGGGVVDSASLAAFTRYLEGGAKRKSRRDQTVVCDGGSSVACIAHGALKGIERDLRRSPTNTPGKEAVQVASRGRGFQAWHLR